MDSDGLKIIGSVYSLQGIRLKAPFNANAPSLAVVTCMLYLKYLDIKEAEESERTACPNCIGSGVDPDAEGDCPVCLGEKRVRPS